MNDNDTRHHEAPSEQVIEAVASWSHVTTGDGPLNSPAFYVKTRQIGHMHLDELPSVDITFPEPLRKHVLADGYTNEHPINTGTAPSRATLFVIESENDIDDAVWLFRLSYLVHVSVLQKREGLGSALKDLDVQYELDKLDPSDAVRDGFETVVADVS